MCGILGGNVPEWDYMNGIKSLRHRGPDAERILSLDMFTLAFARLSIIDLSERGMQPMLSEDGQVAIVYNGEIYAYQKLRARLKKKYIFHSDSDSEVILNTYLEYGEAFTDYIDGIFAIAILDLRERKLKLFRDRAGVKPLYYYVDAGEFAFASELKGIEAMCKTAKLRWDYTGIYDYLFYGYIPDPKTMYQCCRKLPPAHVLTYDIDAREIISVKEYWHLSVNPYKEVKRKAGDLQEELRSLIYESVKDQLVADVPVGTFLSGGTDSSIITYEANRLRPDIKSFSIGFRGGLNFDESYYAQMLSDTFQLNSFIKTLNYSLVASVKGGMRFWYDEPFADTSAYPTYIVSKLAREYVTVILTGDGGDELFGGYLHHGLYAEEMQEKVIDSEFVSRFADRFSLRWMFSPKLQMKYLDSGKDVYSRHLFLTRRDDVEYYRKKWNIPEDYDPRWYVKKYYHRDFPPLTRIRYLDFKTYLVGDILTKVDRASMANSLECRVPYLSRKIMEFAFSLSEDECSNVSEPKKVLKEAYRSILPHEILFRQKQGFCVPDDYLIAEKKRIAISVNLLKRNWFMIR